MKSIVTCVYLLQTNYIQALYCLQQDYYKSLLEWGPGNFNFTIFFKLILFQEKKITLAFQFYLTTTTLIVVWIKMNILSFNGFCWDVRNWYNCLLSPQVKMIFQHNLIIYLVFLLHTLMQTDVDNIGLVTVDMIFKRYIHKVN